MSKTGSASDTNVSIADVEAVWNSFLEKGEKPNPRKVREAFVAAGRFPPALTTIKKWHANGFIKHKGEPGSMKKTPRDRAIEIMSSSAPALTGDPTTRIADVVPSEALKPNQAPVELPPAELTATITPDQERFNELSVMSDEKLITAASRSVYILSVLIAEQVQKQAEFLVKHKTGELSLLHKAIADGVQAGNDGFEKVLMLRANILDLNPKKKQLRAVIEPGDVEDAQIIEDDPMVEQLKAFQKARVAKPKAA